MNETEVKEQLKTLNKKFQQRIFRAKYKQRVQLYNGFKQEVDELYRRVVR